MRSFYPLFESAILYSSGFCVLSFREARHRTRDRIYQLGRQFLGFLTESTGDEIQRAQLLPLVADFLCPCLCWECRGWMVLFDLGVLMLLVGGGWAITFRFLEVFQQVDKGGCGMAVIAVWPVSFLRNPCSFRPGTAPSRPSSRDKDVHSQRPCRRRPGPNRLISFMDTYPFHPGAC